MGRDSGNANLGSVTPQHLPDDLFAEAFAGDAVVPFHWPKNDRQRRQRPRPTRQSPLSPKSASARSERARASPRDRRCTTGRRAVGLVPSPSLKQDVVVATLLKRLWRRPAPQNELHRFRRLSEMLDSWSNETRAQAQRWPDSGLVSEGLRLLAALAPPSSTDRLLATDLHAGNVLRAEREPWLAIDPKPFIGDVAFDVAQHLHNCEARLHADPIGMVKRLADLAEVDAEHLQRWTFARAAADPRPAWNNLVWMEIARALAL